MDFFKSSVIFVLSSRILKKILYRNISPISVKVVSSNRKEQMKSNGIAIKYKNLLKVR